MTLAVPSAASSALQAVEAVAASSALQAVEAVTASSALQAVEAVAASSALQAVEAVAASSALQAVEAGGLHGDLGQRPCSAEVIKDEDTNPAERCVCLLGCLTQHASVSSEKFVCAATLI